MGRKVSYKRVIPRDLFNEGNFLNCIGKIEIERAHHDLDIELIYINSGVYTDRGFVIEQNSADGSLYAKNIRLRIGMEKHTLRRPLNTREKPSVYITYGDDIDLEIFDEDGSFSQDFIEFANQKENEQ